MARVSDDHADASLCAATLLSTGGKPLAGKPLAKRPRLISPEEVQEHNGRSCATFWAVVDGLVVDASEFLDSHPGGLKKLLSTDSAGTGATGKAYGFSFSKGRNAHFPDTGRRFHDGVKRYLNGKSDGGEHLPPSEVTFPGHGSIVILGRLEPAK